MKPPVQMLRNALLAFVLLTIGFALGKDVTARRQAAAGGAVAPVAAGEAGDDRVIVYYLHSTFRCATCNEIERLTRTLVETEFADELAAGRVAWREVNFQEEDALAKRYGVVASCVVVARMEDGHETAFERLDGTWTRYQDPAGFNAYVGAAIRKHLSEPGDAP